MCQGEYTWSQSFVPTAGGELTHDGWTQTVVKIKTSFILGDPLRGLRSLVQTLTRVWRGVHCTPILLMRKQRLGEVETCSQSPPPISDKARI